MVWIKRNLFFVLSAAVGVLLMGGAGYFLYSGINANTTAEEEFKKAVADLESLQNKPQLATREIIQQAEEQKDQVKALKNQVQSLFAPFPVPPKTDEKGFRALLDRSILQLQLAATNAGVGIPNQFAFTFSGIKQKLSFPAKNIDPWSAQLQEVNSICDILFKAKINSLEALRRSRITPDDLGGIDYLREGTATPSTNGLYIRMPYEIVFQAFSGEIAAVLDGFQRATNCYVVKNIDVQPSSGTIRTPMNTAFNPAAMMAAMSLSMNRPQPTPGAALPTPYGAPVTFLSEKTLRVTLLIDVIKLNPQ